LRAACCGGPRIVLLDEPTEGIQPSIIDEIADTLKGVAHKRSLTVLLVEQNLNFIASLSDRILILQKGAVTARFHRRLFAIGDARRIRGHRLKLS